MSNGHLLQPQVVGDIGSPNNVLTLSESDCDVFLALNSDDTTKPLPLPLVAEKPDKCLPPAPSSMFAIKHVYEGSYRPIHAFLGADNVLQTAIVLIFQPYFNSSHLFELSF